MRSYLFVPGDSQRKLDKSLTGAADCLLIDLEDSVSARQKPAARQMSRAFVERVRSAQSDNSPALIVRVNPLSSGLTDDDLRAIIGARPDGVLLPKAEGGKDTCARALEKARQLLADYEQPSLDPAVDESLLAFIRKRQSEIPENML